MKRKFKTMDANEAVANVAYRASEVIAIYPITPSVADGRAGGPVVVRRTVLKIALGQRAPRRRNAE